MKFASILLSLTPLATFVNAAVLHPSNIHDVEREHIERQAVYERVAQSRALDRKTKTGLDSDGYLPCSIDNTENQTNSFEDADSLVGCNQQGGHVKRDSFEGKRIKGDSTDTVYLVLDNKLRGIVSPTVYKALFGTSDITFEKVPQPLVDAYPKGPPLDQQTPLVKGFTNTVYLIDEGKKRGIASEDVFNRYGFSWEQITTIGSVVDLVPDGPVIS